MVIGVPVWLLVRYWRQRRKGEPNNAELTEIGGWLAFLAFVLCLSFLRNLLTFVQDLGSFPHAGKLPAARIPIVIVVVAFAAYLALHLWTIIALFQKRKYFKRLLPIFWIAVALLPLASLAMLTVPGVTLGMLAEEFGRQIGGAIAKGFWLWYG